jgi:hypothetical protein
MSVTIGNQGSQIYVELNHGGKSVQVPCKNEAEAKQVAAAAVEAEKKIEAKEQAQAGNTGTTTPVDLTKSTPPEGVGEKVNTIA